ncbi:unnamed protein product, partial [Staurois parvus]
MQLPVLGCTFLTLSDRFGTDHQGTDDQCPDEQYPAVPPTSSAHLCPAVQPPVPSSAATCAQHCNHLCHPAVPHTCAQQC